MPAIQMPPTPELDKVRAVADKSQIIGEYLEYLESQGVSLMRWTTQVWTEQCEGTMTRDCRNGLTELGTTCQRCGGSGEVERQKDGYVPVTGSIQARLADYFGIDLQKVAEEQEAILTAIRKSHEIQEG